jgi:uracil-DNA glycosylase family 4
MITKKHITQVIHCKRCPELLKYCRGIATEKRKAYLNDTYWGKPVPPFGNLGAKLFIVGLAPAAHGANRTGRMFTGDRSGDWLYRALFKFGFATKPHSISRGDGLELKDTFITATLHCAPPGNKPTPDQLKNCSAHLDFEIKNAPNISAVVCLGKIAYDEFWKALKRQNWKLPKTRPVFKHGKSFFVQRPLGGNTHNILILLSYHPSQQNTFTGKLTESMFDAIFSQANDNLALRK